MDNLKLFSFFYYNLKLLNNLPPIIRNPDLLSYHFSQQKQEIKFQVNKKEIDEYNNSFKDISSYFRLSSSLSFKKYLIGFGIIRLLCIIMAYYSLFELCFITSLFQFLLMPLSFFISFGTLILLSPAIIAAHYITIIPLMFIYNLIIPEYFYGYIEITNIFIIIFFIIDQLLCIICYFRTPIGKTKPFGKKIWIHVFWGFFNCKTYTLILLLLIRGYKLNLTLWIFDYIFGFTRIISLLLSKYISHWAVLFYHQHRIAHIPRVYEQAHKFHHYLHDTSSFDAHIYGSGAPEEWFSLFFEVILCLYFGIPPASLSANALTQSWANKTGHTRKLITSGGVNHHPDHHTYHRKNFGIYNAILDMLYETNTDNNYYEYGNYKITKEIKNNSIIEFTCVINDSATLSQEIMKEYYSPSIKSFIKSISNDIINVFK